MSVNENKENSASLFVVKTRHRHRQSATHTFSDLTPVEETQQIKKNTFDFYKLHPLCEEQNTLQMAAHARMWFDYEVTSDIIVCMLHFYLFSLWFAWTVCALCLWHPVPVHGVFLLRYHFTICLDQWDFRLILDARTLLRSQTASFFKLLEGVRVGFTVRIRKIVHQIYSPPGSRGYAQERRLSRSRICKHRQTRMQRLLM